MHKLMHAHAHSYASVMPHAHGLVVSQVFMAKKSVSSHENLENFDSQMVLSLSQMVLHAAPPSGPRPLYGLESEKRPAEQPNGILLQKKGS